MKCQLEVKAFRKRLVAAAAVVPRRTFKPILDTVRLVVDDGGQGTLVATDLETWVRVRAPLRRGASGGAVQLPRQAFLKLLAGSQDAALELEADPEASGLAGGPEEPAHSLVVSGSQTRVTLRTYRPEDYPDRAEQPEPSYHELEVRHLQRLIRTTVFATDAAHLRYQLGGCWFGFGVGSVDVVATDGRRLARAWRTDARIVGEPAPPQTHVATDRPRVVAPVVGAHALRVLDGLLEELKSPHQAVQLAWTRDGYLQVRAPGLLFSTRQLEGRFPDWRDAFPQPSPHRAHWGRTDRLLGVLKQAKAMADRDNPKVRLGLRPGGLTLSVQAVGGGTCDFQTQSEYRSEPVEAEFLPSDLIEVLTLVKDEAVDLVLGEPGMPAVLHATGLSVAVMPVGKAETPAAATDEPPDEDPADPEFSEEDEFDPPDEPIADVPGEQETAGPGDSGPAPGQNDRPIQLPADRAGGSAETPPLHDPQSGVPAMSLENPRGTPPPDEEPAGPKTQPVHVVRLRNVRAAIWENETEYGPRYSTTVSRLYKDANEQQWRSSESFGRDDLLLLAKVLDLAHTWIYAQAQGQEVPF